MQIKENKSTYTPSDMLCITERIGNAKRSYLLCNKLQGKYIPVDPLEAMDMFHQLARQVPRKVRGNLIVVGFAETATGIGAAVAEMLTDRGNVTFLPTTREPRDVIPICEFKEEHSHAVEQILYGTPELFEKANWVVFVEDEVTTGKTIRNCVTELREKFPQLKYLVASLLNCMSDAELRLFKEASIECCYLVKASKPSSLESTIPRSVAEITAHVPDPRLGVNAATYALYMKDLSERISDTIPYGGTTLLLGTEECIYPAIRIGTLLALKGIRADVVTTTRVPTYPNKDLKNRVRVSSAYANRDTYLYGTQNYDVVVLITDGTYTAGIEDIRDQLVNNYGVPYVLIVRLT